MIDLLIETLAKMYDATIRGVCVSLTLAPAFVVLAFLFKKTPAFLKAVGLW